MSENQPTRKPRRGDEFEATIERYGRRGHSLGSSGEYDVRISGGVPGDRWKLSVKKRRRQLLEGHRLELLEPGAARVEARCRHSEQCGGCSFQSCSYDVQLEQKHLIVREAFESAGLEELPAVEAVLGCEDPWRYRNKMEFTFGARRWIAPEEPQGVKADFAVGLHPPGLFSKVIDLSECHLVFAEGEAILLSARELAIEQGFDAWDVYEHVGFLRHLVVRKGFNTGEVMVNLVTFSEDAERFDPYARALLERHPEITTLIQTIHSGVASVAFGERERIIHGPGWIEEELGGLRFRISARSFFQVNIPQAVRLFDIVCEEAGARGDEVVYDLYSGAGTISLLLAGAVKEVLGFEQVPEAVADARDNAERNGISNVRFFEGDVLHELDQAVGENSELPRPDVCIVDPPRAGLHPSVPHKLLALGAQRIVYVSCNIHNGVQDIAQLVAGGYRVTRVRPVDMFPHTPHVECVVTLDREL